MKRTMAPKAMALLLCMLLAAVPSWAADSDDDDLIISAITVQGNDGVATETILEQVQATRVGDALDTEKVQEDVNRIADLGLFESVEARPVGRQHGVEIIFLVEEFPVIRTVEVVVKEGVISSAEARQLFSVKEGETLNAKALGEELDEIAVSETLGYVLRPAEVMLSGDRGERLYIELAPVRVGEIIIEGNEKTRDIVIRRELTFESGEILSMEALRVSLNKLGQLGYFEPVIPEFLMTDDPFVIDVLLPITELKTGQASFGGGYSSVDGLLGYIEVSDRNFLGRGEQANIKWQFGQRTNTYDLGFHEPYLFGAPTSVGLNLYNRHHNRIDYVDGGSHPYTEKRVGGDLTFGRPLGAYTRGFLTLKIDNSTIEPDETPSPVLPSDDRTRSLIVNTRTDTTDYLFYPTTGFRHDLSVELASAMFGGDTQFTKYQTSFSKFMKAGSNNQTWAFRVMAGVGVGDVPFYEKFRVGGSESVRGYRYGEMRGDRMFVAQGEYRFPIAERVHGVVFVDAGNAWEGNSINLGDLKAGVGVGIRFDTPIGMMRIDYGVGQGGGQAYFSLGPSF